MNNSGNKKDFDVAKQSEVSTSEHKGNELTMKNYSIQTVEFHGQNIPTIFHNEKYYVGMKAIVENIGLDWTSQVKKIKRHPVLSQGMVMMTTTGKDNKLYKMLCLPLEMLNGWLFGIEANRVKGEIKDVVIKYQRECFSVLFNHFHKPVEQPALPNLSTTESRVPLKDAVNMMVPKVGLSYSECYRMIHQRMGVKSVEALTNEQVTEAVEYVHRVVLNGELMPRIEKKDQSEGLTLLQHGEDAKRAQDDKLMKAERLLSDAMVALNEAKLYSGAVWDGLHESRLHIDFSREDREKAGIKTQRYKDYWDARKGFLA